MVVVKISEDRTLYECESGALLLIDFAEDRAVVIPPKFGREPIEVELEEFYASCVLALAERSRGRGSQGRLFDEFKNESTGGIGQDR